MEQPGFPFDAPIVDVRTVSPTGEPQPPAGGRFRASKHASLTGAAAVVKTWAARQSSYLQVVKNAGAITDQDAASVLEWPLSSVNSVRGALNDFAEARGHAPMLVPDGHDVYTSRHPTTGEPFTTRRTRWTVNPHYHGPR